MASKAMAISALVLRILTLLLSAACLAVFLIDTFTNADGSKTTFKDVFAYRYVLSTAVIGTAYSLLQLPFTIYLVSTEKRLIPGQFLPEFDFYLDKVISFPLASGVGTGFGVTFEMKKLVNDFFDSLIAAGIPQAEESRGPIEKFLDKAYIANGLLLGAFVCTATISVISSISRPKTSSGFFK